MPMSFEDFVAASNAEVVCGNIIVGTLGNRKVVGTITESFQLNEDGLALQAELEAGGDAGAPKKTRGKKAEAEAPVEVPAEEAK